VAVKEFIQMRRDRLTFAMMLGIPCFQLTIFGYAINTDPKHLPTVVVAGDTSPVVRTVTEALRQTDYFAIEPTPRTETDALGLLERGETQFVLTFPVDFTRTLLRGDQPAVLLEVDATDPVAAGNAISAMQDVINQAVTRDLQGSFASRQPANPPVDFRLHLMYNPERLSQYNIVPGLLGVVLTMTMVIITSLAITREKERGTMENLLCTPARPLEVMTGKILPYIAVGYIQASLILVAARFLFGVPEQGSLLLLALCALVFIAANLGVGITFSTVARNQLQAMQMAFFFFLPSILLSGFMFPFRGMPEWAQDLGTVLPLTHFLRIVRGILLKGNGFAEVWPNLWPIALFFVVVMSVGLARFRRTLD
jgi:ABC-2 type transport system permease protein